MIFAVCTIFIVATIVVLICSANPRETENVAIFCMIVQAASAVALAWICLRGAP